MKAGMALSKVAEEFSLAWVAHGRGLTSLRQQLKLDADRRSFRARGPGGMGAMGAFRDGEEPFRSSLLARRLLEGAGEQVVDGYSGQETVVLDDFKDYAMPLVELQRLLDWYPLWVEVKGGACR